MRKRLLRTLVIATVAGSALAALSDTGSAKASSLSTPAFDPATPLASPAAAPDTALGARNFVDSMGERAVAFLSDPSIGQEQRKSRFRSLLRDSYDMDTISRFALGRYWRLASAQQRKEYRRLFEDMVVDVYARRFEDYKGQKFLVRSQRPDGPSDTIVTSSIVPSEGPEVRVDWRVRYKGGQYRIVDVIVEGVSMAMTQRSDFSAVIQKGGGNVDVLIDHLRGNP